jgi:hypothetical protein
VDIMGKIIWRDGHEVYMRLREYAEDYDVVFVGTHDTASYVTEQFISNCYKGDYHHTDIPGDGEPGIYVANNVDADREAGIVAAFEDWYIDGFPGDSDMVELGDLDSLGRYGLGRYLNIDASILFVTIFGDSPCPGTPEYNMECEEEEPLDEE